MICWPDSSFHLFLYLVRVSCVVAQPIQRYGEKKVMKMFVVVTAHGAKSWRRRSSENSITLEYAVVMAEWQPRWWWWWICGASNFFAFFLLLSTLWFMVTKVERERGKVIKTSFHWLAQQHQRRRMQLKVFFRISAYMKLFYSSQFAISHRTFLLSSSWCCCDVCIMKFSNVTTIACIFQLTTLYTSHRKRGMWGYGQGVRRIVWWWNDFCTIKTSWFTFQLYAEAIRSTLNDWGWWINYGDFPHHTNPLHTTTFFYCTFKCICISLWYSLFLVVDRIDSIDFQTCNLKQDKFSWADLNSTLSTVNKLFVFLLAEISRSKFS